MVVQLAEVRPEAARPAEGPRAVALPVAVLQAVDRRAVDQLVADRQAAAPPVVARLAEVRPVADQLVAARPAVVQLAVGPAPFCEIDVGLRIQPEQTLLLCDVPSQD